MEKAYKTQPSIFIFLAKKYMALCSEVNNIALKEEQEKKDWRSELSGEKIR